MRPKTREAMERLFRAEWNIPRAAEYCDLTCKECKIVFDEYCRLNPATYTPPEK